MIKSIGNDAFSNYVFNKYNWSANTYETPEEICCFLDSLNLRKKRITRLTAIGASTTVNLKYPHTVLKNAGIITRYDRKAASYVLYNGDTLHRSESSEIIESTLVDRSVTLYEPLIIHFDDGSSLELLPCSVFGLRIGYNSIPDKITDGINHQEFDIGLFFNKFITNQQIFTYHIIRCSDSREIYYGNNNYTKLSVHYEYHFVFGDNTLIIHAMEGNKFTVALDRTSKILYRDYCAIKKSPCQKAILEERNHHAQTVIYPVHIGQTDRYAFSDYQEGFSIFGSLPKGYYPLLDRFRKREPEYLSPPSFFEKNAILEAVNTYLAFLCDFKSKSIDEQWQEWYWYLLSKSFTEKAEILATEIDYAVRFSAHLFDLATHMTDDELIVLTGNIFE